MLWQGLGAHVQNLLRSAHAEALIVAPFIKYDALKGLLEAVPGGVAITVYTRWRAEEVAVGVSDLETLELTHDRGAELRLVDELHAKLYVVDGARALIGSANVTNAALGTARRPNLELLQLAELNPAEIAAFKAELFARSRQATEEEAQIVRTEAASFERVEVAARDAQPRAEEALYWLPSFRSPDRIYQIIKRGDEDELRGSLRDDLIGVSISAVGSEEGFLERVRHALRRTLIVRELDGFLSQPRRFGELTAWLRERLPDSTHEARQETMQTLIRWLLYFDADRYEMATPNYSEILRLRQH